MFVVGNRQVPTAFGTAARQYLAAIFCAHALTETMFVHSLALGRLISPFHFIVVLQLPKLGFF